MVLFYCISALVLVTGILVWRRPGATRALLMAFAAVQVGFTVYAALHSGATDLRYFTYDPLGLLFLGLLTLISLAVIFYGLIYFHHEGMSRYHFYHGALIGLITSISLAYLANDVTVVWILVEATTLTASVLIYHEKTAHALEATWKYLFLCSVGIAFAYMGILFLSLTTKGQSVEGLSFANLAAVAATADPLYLKIAFLFVFIGYSTKMELFPMHTVAIDANSVAPAPIGGLLSTGLANLGFLSIFRVYKSLDGSAIQEWMNHIFLLSGVLSVLVAAGYMLKARHHKRMLAYSSLEVMGLVAIAIGVGGKGHYAAILLLIVHGLTKSSLFFQFGQVFRILKVMKTTESGNYFALNPAGGMVLLLGLIAILAIPPSG
ncbi:MAG: proton-conducting transporter membrane subunit, partial [Bacteroidales bacterium]